jgi:hypothetical protein
VPPLDERVYVLPSVPLTVTLVALLAFTVRVDDAPLAIDAGFELMLIVGAGEALFTVRLMVV